MPLVRLPDLFPDPLPAIWAVGCFSVYSLESITAVIRAAEAEKSPAALSIDNKAIEHSGLGPLAKACLQAATEASVPVTVHLNHARSLDLVQRAIDLGIPSIMFDGSDCELKKNIESTAKAAQLAHSAGATLEGELGPLDISDLVHTARLFTEYTIIDYLALSVPETLAEKKKSYDFGLLKILSNAIESPLVIHRASRLSHNQLVQVLNNGIRKVNVHTELLRVFGQEISLSLNSNPNGNPLGWLDNAAWEVTKLVRQRIRLFHNYNDST